MAKQMTATEQKNWQKKVIARANEVIASHGRERAEQFIWNRYGAPTEIKNGLLRIWFGREAVDL